MEAPQLAISLVRMLDDIKCCNETIDEAYCSPAMENDRPICAVRPHASERGDILEHWTELCIEFIKFIQQISFINWNHLQNMKASAFWAILFSAHLQK